MLSAEVRGVPEKMTAPDSEKNLSKWTIFGYGLGHVCNDICASMWFTYLLLFLQKVIV